MHQNCPGKEEHQQEQQNFSIEKQHLNTPIMLFPTIVEYILNLDCTINPIEDLFDQEVFRTYIKLENLLLKAGKGDVFIQEYNDQ